MIARHNTSFLARFRHIDLLLLFSAVSITLAGMLTMYSYAENNSFFERQLVWLVIAIGACITVSFIDFRFLRRTSVVVFLFLMTLLTLIAVLLFGDVVKGAQSRFGIGSVAIQPAEYAKIVIIIVLAKYFARRHVAIADARHIVVSGIYALIPFLLITLQPDFGSAIIIGSIWFGMVLVSGLSKRHLVAVLGITALSVVGLWSFVFADYQKERIMTFLHPLADITGAGYNAYQSTIAVGSGQLFGKGIGYGTQSKLQFLPEYETDFIFASFAEEWGFFGVLVLFALFGVLFARILAYARQGGTNFETLFALGIAVLLVSHVIIHIGMNIGLLPVTGITLPFMSYGGSHLVASYIALGMLMAMRRYAAVVHRSDAHREFVGL